MLVDHRPLPHNVIDEDQAARFRDGPAHGLAAGAADERLELTEDFHLVAVDEAAEGEERDFEGAERRRGERKRVASEHGPVEILQEERRRRPDT